MKVQRIVIPERNVVSWILLDDSYRPVKPVLEFLDYQRCLQRSPDSIRAYAYRLKHFWEFLQEVEAQYDDLSHMDRARFIEWMRWPGGAGAEARIAPKHSAKTINVTLAAVDSFLRFHECSQGFTMPRTHRRIWNPSGEGYKPFLSHIKSTKKTKAVVEQVPTELNRPPTLTEEETQKLWEGCRLKRDKFLVTLLLETGMRIGQALGLRHEDIRSWDNEIIVRHREDNTNGARAKMSRLGKNTIQVDDALMALYLDYLMSEAENIASDYVFVTLSGPNTGRPLEYPSVYRLFRRLEGRTGVRATPHMYRHTHATELIEKHKWDVALVQRRLGHSSPQTTTSYYIHISDATLKEASYRISEKKREAR